MTVDYQERYEMLVEWLLDRSNEWNVKAFDVQDENFDYKSQRWNDPTAQAVYLTLRDCSKELRNKVKEVT